MSGYHSSSEISGMRAPRKPLLKSVALPANSPMNSPIALNFPRNESARPSRFPWVSASLPSRSQTPVPPPTRHPNLSFQEAAVEPPGNPLAYQTSSRTRKTSVSSNISDFAIAPLKGILKKTGSSTRSSTPAPSTRNHVPPVKPEATMHAISTSSGESNLGHRYHHRRAESKTSSSSSSKVDGYSSDSHMLWNRKVSHDGDASRPAYGNGKPLGGHRRATPSAVPMKAEAIALNWPLREPERSPRKQRLNICFDVAFDPRVTKGVTVPYDTDIAHRKDMSHDDIRLPASTHCTLTEMRIFLDLEEFKCWPIKVKRKEGVRCLDVYEAIYKTLQHRLTDDDVRTFGEARIQRCRKYCLQRCIDSPGLPDYNKQRGIRRVDLLEGRRFFRGLVQSGEDWKLHLG
ncbi:hypothetical protein J3R30DRAFT_3696977 [Lentinula aciculospora]|uniref:DUF6699 domain-containing protein n=1 Tax=Lentinula aciculospora TaxID=153920 RepID=A0A9W9ALE9_9AGAR|nr:hypothetical protein J3R30DRAFT_3696977 [Lentinula aciculospora]